uniref:Uncharacterized protein n=1 Tax=Nicotiana tabacum TaxID=4097 RepID=A0A1S4DF06_TOBAC|nr:PREDICTED: uncharacterized protein LOC107829029 [Nicotiana tabacum]
MKNREARPTGSVSFIEANMVATRDKFERRQNNYQGHMNVCGLGKRRCNNRHRGGHSKWENNMGSQNNPSREKCNNYHRCGMKCHWKHECSAPEYFVRLYQNATKRKIYNVRASSASTPVESHLTFRNDAEAGPSNKYDDNAEANHTFKDEDFFEDQN